MIPKSPPIQDARQSKSAPHMATYLRLLGRPDVEHLGRIYREGLIREYGEVPSPILLSYVGGQRCLPDGTRQLTMWGRVIATVPPFFPKRRYGEPSFAP